MHNKQLIDKMLKIATDAAACAYAPYSKFHVGACVEAEDGSLFGGCNIENAAYSPTICAEVAAISSMITAGKKKIKSILVLGPGNVLCTPCGRCRQVIREFVVSLDTPVYLCSEDVGLMKTVTLGYLLPDSFGPENLEVVAAKK